MKYFLSLLLLVPFLASADARLELDTGTCHAPWNEADADQEYKYSCKIWSLQNANGTYNAQAETTFTEVMGGAVKGLGEYGSDGVQNLSTDCSVTAGTFQDDNGTEFTTNNCSVQITYTRTQHDWRHDVKVFIRLWGAAQTEGATLRSLDGTPAPVPAGVSKAVRY